MILLNVVMSSLLLCWIISTVTQVMHMLQLLQYIYIYNPSSQQQRSSIMVSLYKLHNPDNRNSNDRGKASIHLYWFITLTLTSTIRITEIFWDIILHYVGSCLQSKKILRVHRKHDFDSNCNLLHLPSKSFNLIKKYNIASKVDI